MPLKSKTVLKFIMCSSSVTLREICKNTRETHINSYCFISLVFLNINIHIFELSGDSHHWLLYHHSHTSALSESITETQHIWKHFAHYICITISLVYCLRFSFIHQVSEVCHHASTLALSHVQNLAFGPKYIKTAVSKQTKMYEKSNSCKSFTKNTTLYEIRCKHLPFDLRSLPDLNEKEKQSQNCVFVTQVTINP